MSFLRTACVVGIPKDYTSERPGRMPFLQAYLLCKVDTDFCTEVSKMTTEELQQFAHSLLNDNNQLFGIDAQMQKDYEFARSQIDRRTREHFNDTRIRISPDLASQGGAVDFAFGGNTITVKIPPGTRNDSILRLRKATNDCDLHLRISINEPVDTKSSLMTFTGWNNEVGAKYHFMLDRGSGTGGSSLCGICGGQWHVTSAFVPQTPKLVDMCKQCLQRLKVRIKNGQLINNAWLGEE